MNEILNIDLNKILAFIADEGLIVSPLSPFYAEDPAGKGSGVDAKASPLVRTVCDPSAVASARILSSGGIVVTRVYADKSGKMLVRHWMGKDGKHNFRQVEEKEIAEEAALRLMLDVPPSKLEFSAELSEAAFCGLLGMSDSWRERTLLSLLDRKPKSVNPYTFEETYAAYRRSICSDDMRWLTSIVKAFYPESIDISPADFAKGIMETGSDFIDKKPGGFAVTPLGEEIFKSLTSPIAAIKLTVSGIKGGAVVEQALIGLRGMGMFCTIEPPVSEGGKVRLQNSSAPMVELYLHTRMAEAISATREYEAQKLAASKVQPVPAPVSMTSPSAAQKTVKKFCSECGKPLKPETRFCAECGHKV